MYKEGAEMKGFNIVYLVLDLTQFSGKVCMLVSIVGKSKCEVIYNCHKVSLYTHSAGINFY